MPLTPEDVSNKRFTAVRLREGYDMGEVDAFLDEVETELTRLLSENDELRAKLEAALAGHPAGDPPARIDQPAAVTDAAVTDAAVTDAAGPDAAATDGAVTSDTSAVPAVSTVATPVTTSPVTSLDKPRGVETIQVSTTAEASAAATRLLELATRSADELMADAQAQADTVLASARADAERLEQEARSRAEQVDVETSQRREQLFSALDRDRTSLASEVESLRTFEREYRAELKDYFVKQLDALEHPLAHSERFGTGAEPSGTRVTEAPQNGTAGG